MIPTCLGSTVFYWVYRILCIAWYLYIDAGDGETRVGQVLELGVKPLYRCSKARRG